jgi:hypothetical protein
MVTRVRGSHEVRASRGMWQLARLPAVQQMPRRRGYSIIPARVQQQQSYAHLSLATPSSHEIRGDRAVRPCERIEIYWEGECSVMVQEGQLVPRMKHRKTQTLCLLPAESSRRRS